MDNTDSLFPCQGTTVGLDDLSFAVAAVRECFEEAGVWLGKGTPSEALRAQLHSRDGTLPTDGSLVADLDRIRQWSWWITPDTEPKRYDTRFFVCCLDPSEQVHATQDDYETVEVCWITPSKAVERHEAGEMFMAPPTYLTLLELQHLVNVEAVWEMAKDRVILPIQPIHDKRDGALHILLPTHDKHPSKEPDLGGTKVVYQEGRWSLR